MIAIVGALSALWAALWLSGLPYFTDDYDRWLARAARTDWGTLALELSNPWGGADASWGFTRRPAIVAIFKLLGRGGASPALVFGFKALAFGLLVALLFWTARRLAPGPAAWLAPLAVVCCHGAFASLAWAGDMAVLADLAILVSLVAFAQALAPRPRSERWRAVAWTAAALLAELLAVQTKANGRLVPAILFAALALRRRSGLRRGLPALAAAALLALPVGPLLSGHRPPWLLRPASDSGFEWHRASLSQLWAFTLGGLGPGIGHPFTPSISIAAELWPLALGALAVLALSRRARSESAAPLLRDLVLGWAALALLATASYPAINPFFQRRYLIDLVVPASLAFALLADAGLRRLAGARRRVALGALALAALAQASSGFARTLADREARAPVASIADRLNRTAAREPAAPLRAYLDGYLPYEFWPPLAGRAETVARPALRSLPPGALVFAWGVPLEDDLALVCAEDGATGALIDRLRALPLPVGSLSRRLPPSPARARALALAAEGRWAEAAPALEAALREADVPRVRLSLGVADLELGRPADADRILAPIDLPAAPELRPARFDRALAILKEGRAAEAAERFQRLAGEDPSDLDSAYDAAVALREAGRLAEAKAAFERLLAARPDHAGALANLRELRSSPRR